MGVTRVTAYSRYLLGVSGFDGDAGHARKADI